MPEFPELPHNYIFLTRQQVHAIRESLQIINCLIVPVEAQRALSTAVQRINANLYGV